MTGHPTCLCNDTAAGEVLSQFSWIHLHLQVCCFHFREVDLVFLKLWEIFVIPQVLNVQHMAQACNQGLFFFFLLGLIIFLAIYCCLKMMPIKAARQNQNQSGKTSVLESDNNSV